jgi:hypothetical protein
VTAQADKIRESFSEHMRASLAGICEDIEQLRASYPDAPLAAREYLRDSALELAAELEKTAQRIRAFVARDFH